MDVTKDGWKCHLAENCGIGLGAIPASFFLLARSIPPRGGPFQRFPPLAYVAAAL